MGACADLLYKYREERLQADRDASELKAREQRLIDYIVDNLDKDSGGAVGKTHKVEVIREEKPTVKDWPLMFAYIAKNKAWDMVQRRINPAALQARIDDGKTIPGWEPFMVVKVSLTKRGR
jgi:hypothetical protein